MSLLGAKPASVIWHDLECGGYVEDLALWRSLAVRHGDPVLDVGAGTGRVALDLARGGHRVTALDHDPTLLCELARRARGVDVRPVVADARDFDLPEAFSLILVPMQTIQLLGGAGGRMAFLRCARRHLQRGGVLAVSIAQALEPYEVRPGSPAPRPDTCELDGVVYCSQPTAVRLDGDGFVLERDRQTANGGQRTVERDSIRLERVGCEQLEREALAVGLTATGTVRVSPTPDYFGSLVVMLGV